MTLRIYVRWPNQVVTDKTVTESETVAALALDELKQQREGLKERGALGIAFSRDGKQAEYVELNSDAARG
jgi:hypothetical protein